MVLLELLAVSAIGVGTSAVSPPQAQPRQDAPKASLEVEMEVRDAPKARTLSYIMQTNPEGFRDLLQAVGARSSDGAFLRGSFSPAEISRMVSGNQGGRTQGTRTQGARAQGSRTQGSRTQGKVTAQNATQQRRVLGSLGSLIKFAPDKLVTKDPLDFGKVQKDGPTPSLEVSGTVYGEGSASWSLSGSKAFSVSLVKTTDWVSNASGDGYEKTVEHGGSKFPVTAGTQYRVVVRFDPKAAAGPQSGQLQIQEPNRTVVVPLKGDTFEKSLGVTVKSFSPSSVEIMPNDAVEVTVNLDVTQNSGSQLRFKATEKVKGIEVVSENQWVAKPGSVTQKVRIRTDGQAEDSLSTPVTIGIYPVNGATPLATFTVPLKIQRQWTEWKYSQSVGKQKVWGKLQVSNTGDYIWDVECYNSSYLFSDTFIFGFAMKGIPAKGGKNPGSFFLYILPVPNTEITRVYFREVGKFTSSDFQAIRTSKMAVYLGVEEGGILGQLGQMVQQVVDGAEAMFTDDPYKMMPDNMPSKWIKWMLKNNFVKTTGSKMQISY